MDTQSNLVAELVALAASTTSSAWTQWLMMGEDTGFRISDRRGKRVAVVMYPGMLRGRAKLVPGCMTLFGLRCQCQILS